MVCSWGHCRSALRRNWRPSGISHSFRDVNTSCRSTDRRVCWEDSRGARASHAATPNVLPDRSICSRPEESARACKCCRTSSAVLSLKPWPASENFVEFILTLWSYRRIVGCRSPQGQKLSGACGEDRLSAHHFFPEILDIQKSFNANSANIEATL